MLHGGGYLPSYFRLVCFGLVKTASFFSPSCEIWREFACLMLSSFSVRFLFLFTFGQSLDMVCHAPA
jgi:hypothetical protein